MKTTAPAFSKAKCCGNCANRTRYHVGGDMYGYDKGSYECTIHKMDYDGNGVIQRNLCVDDTDICDDFKGEEMCPL